MPPTLVSVLRCCAELDRLDARLALPRPREIAAPHVAEPSRDRVRRLHVDHEQVRLEPGSPRDDLAGFVEDDRVPVEDELVLSADEVAEGEVGARVTSAGDEHLLAVLGLADVVRGRRQVHDELGSRESQIRRRRAGLPDVLADCDPDRDAADAQHDEVAALREVAVLVEDAVVRQVVLPVHGPHLAVGAHRARIREVAVEPRRADERDDTVGLGGDALGRGARCADEGGAQEEVLRRIPGRRELRVDDEVRPASRASASASRMSSRLPSRSPTTASICASAILTGVFASQSQTSV